MIATSAPGRVNLIGEHTDYNDGLVLPTPIPQRACAELVLRDDNQVVATSAELAATASYTLGKEHRTGSWIDYVQGCTAAVQATGHRLRGMNLRLRSAVPLGAGLSSSAALEVAVLRAIRMAFDLAIDDVSLALLGQRAENELVGAPVGAMDQLAASVGEPGAALFIDIRTLQTRKIPLPAADLIVIASGIEHDHAAGDYRKRRAECEEAARQLEVRTLRDLTPSDRARVERLSDPLARRVRHVLTENARVLALVDALERGELARIGPLFHESHASMRDDYEVSVPAIDRLVEIAEQEPVVYGARLTGGGFGGSIVAFAMRGEGNAAAQRICERYRESTAREPRVLLAGEVPCVPS